MNKSEDKMKYRKWHIEKYTYRNIHIETYRKMTYSNDEK